MIIYVFLCFWAFELCPVFLYFRLNFTEHFMYISLHIHACIALGYNGKYGLLRQIISCFLWSVLCNFKCWLKNEKENKNILNIPLFFLNAVLFGFKNARRFKKGSVPKAPEIVCQIWCVCLWLGVFMYVHTMSTSVLHSVFWGRHLQLALEMCRGPGLLKIRNCSLAF